MSARLGSTLARNKISSLPYQALSWSALVRGWCVLKLSSWKRFAQNAERFHRISQRLLGRSITSKLVEGSFYHHFVAGAAPADLQAAVARLAAHRVYAMVLPPMEDISSEFSAAQVETCAQNTKQFLQYLDVVRDVSRSTQQQAVMQFKLSGACPTSAMNIYSEDLLVKGVPLQAAVEDIVSYLSGKTDHVGHCSHLIQPALEMGLKSCDQVFRKAMEYNIPILIDAELKAAHQAMYAISLASAALHCRDKPMIFGTYQCYMKHVPQLVNESARITKELGACFAAKIVRGAYMNHEQQEARRRNEPDPICPDAAATSSAYNDVVAGVLNRIADSPKRTAIFICTHNIESIRLAKSRIDALGLRSEVDHIRFAQIYGMSDQISYTLATDGYTVYKSIPFGPAEGWIPYLGRRAAENYTALQNARNELPYYRHEMLRRLKLSRNSPAPVEPIG